MDVVVLDATGAVVSSFGGTSTPASTATISSIGATATSTTLFLASASRKEGIIYNNSNRTLRVALVSATTPTLFSFVVPAGQSVSIRNYTGVVSGQADVTPGPPFGGTWLMTELT